MKKSKAEASLDKAEVLALFKKSLAGCGVDLKKPLAKYTKRDLDLIARTILGVRDSLPEEADEDGLYESDSAYVYLEETTLDLAYHIRDRKVAEGKKFDHVEFFEDCGFFYSGN